MKEKSIKKNYILNVAYQILTIIVPFITTPYISRVLQAEGVGAYSYTLAIASYIGVFATVGMDVYGQLHRKRNVYGQCQCIRPIANSKVPG